MFVKPSCEMRQHNAEGLVTLLGGPGVQRSAVRRKTRHIYFDGFFQKTLSSLKS